MEQRVPVILDLNATLWRELFAIDLQLKENQGLVVFRREQIVVIFIVLGMALRLFGLARESLWYDEFLTASFIQMSWRDLFLYSFTVDANPPLFYLLEKLCVSIFGSSELGLRLLSGGVGAANVLLFALLAKRVQGNLSAVFSIGLYAFSAVSISFAQEARSYSLTCLLVMLYYFCYLQWDEKRFAKWGMLLAGFLAVQNHYYSLVFLSLLFPVALARRQSAAAIFSSVITLVGALEFLIFKGASGVQDAGWLNYHFVHNLSLWQKLIYVPEFFLTTNQDQVAFPWVGLLASVFFLGCLSWLWFFRKERESRISLELGAIFIAAVIGVAILDTWVLPIMLQRYFLPAFPFFILVLTSAIGKFPPKLRLALGSFVALAFSLQLYFYYTRPNKEQWREAVSYILNHEVSEPLPVSCCYLNANVAWYYFAQAERLISSQNSRGSGAVLMQEPCWLTPKGSNQEFWYIYNNREKEHLAELMQQEKMALVESQQFFRVGIAKLKRDTEK